MLECKHLANLSDREDGGSKCYRHSREGCMMANIEYLRGKVRLEEGRVEKAQNQVDKAKADLAEAETEGREAKRKACRKLGARNADLLFAQSELGKARDALRKAEGK